MQAAGACQCAVLTWPELAPQAYYRRADANVGMGRMKKALADFRRAAQVAPRDPDLRKKLEQCEREVKRIRFEEALATPVRERATHVTWPALGVVWGWAQAWGWVCCLARGPTHVTCGLGAGLGTTMTCTCKAERSCW